MTSLRRNATRANPRALRGMTEEDPTGGYRIIIASAVLVHSFRQGPVPRRLLFSLPSCDCDWSTQPRKLLVVDFHPWCRIIRTISVNALAQLMLMPAPTADLIF